MAGRLRHRVTVQRQATTQDALGQRTEAWTEHATTWAMINPVSGRDFFTQSGEHADITHKITLRHGVDIRPGDRIVYSGRNFDVRSVLNLGERDRFINVMAVEDADV